jgi:Holliday junction resolvase RusA-like endonuclease
MSLRPANTMSLADYRRSQGLPEQVEPAPLRPGSEPRVTRPEELREALVRSLADEKLRRIDQLMDAEPGTPEGEELDRLVDEVAALEAGIVPGRQASDGLGPGNNAKKFNGIRITIPGEPVAWARARSNGARRFTPAKQAAWMAMAQHYAVQQYGPLPPVTDALSLHVIATFAIPQSWTKSRKSAALAGTLRHTSKPDASNILKLVEDAMNGVVFVDDAQVTRALVEKRYGEPGVSVAVEVL